MKIAIIGQGGHSKVIRDIILSNKENQIVGYLDDRFEELTIKNELYFGPLLSVPYFIDHFKGIKFIIAIGNNQVRKSIVQKLALPDEYFETLIHTSAKISHSAKIGTGSVVMANAVINADAQIGQHSIINTSAVIEHDNQIGHFVHVSPNATLTGSIKIKDGVHVGAGATIIPNISIGEWAIIGAGATVINHIPANNTAVGNPAMVKIKSH